jgi:hypothetical protein
LIIQVIEPKRQRIEPSLKIPGSKIYHPTSSLSTRLQPGRRRS